MGTERRSSTAAAFTQPTPKHHPTPHPPPPPGPTAAFTVDLGGPPHPRSRSMPTPASAATTASAAPPVLRLERFAPSAVMEYGTVAVGVPVTATLVLENPATAPSTAIVTLEKMLPPAFHVAGLLGADGTALTLAPGAVATVTVAWLPAGVGGMRETLALRVNGRQRAAAVLFGTAVLPVAPSAPSRRLALRERAADANVPPPVAAAVAAVAAACTPLVPAPDRAAAVAGARRRSVTDVPIQLFVGRAPVVPAAAAATMATDAAPGGIGSPAAAGSVASSPSSTPGSASSKHRRRSIGRRVVAAGPPAAFLQCMRTFEAVREAHIATLATEVAAAPAPDAAAAVVADGTTAAAATAAAAATTTRGGAVRSRRHSGLSSPPVTILLPKAAPPTLPVATAPITSVTAVAASASSPAATEAAAGGAGAAFTLAFSPPAPTRGRRASRSGPPARLMRHQFALRAAVAAGGGAAAAPSAAAPVVAATPGPATKRGRAPVATGRPSLAPRIAAALLARAPPAKAASAAHPAPPAVPATPAGLGAATPARGSRFARVMAARARARGRRAGGAAGGANARPAGLVMPVTHADGERKAEMALLASWLNTLLLRRDALTGTAPGTPAAAAASADLAAARLEARVRMQAFKVYHGPSQEGTLIWGAQRGHFVTLNLLHLSPPTPLSPPVQPSGPRWQLRSRAGGWQCARTRRCIWTRG